jgi:hypothetical protein
VADIDWPKWPRDGKQQPTKRQASLYRRWREYLYDSKLTPGEQHRRAAAFTLENKPVPKG